MWHRVAAKVAEATEAFKALVAPGQRADASLHGPRSRKPAEKQAFVILSHKHKLVGILELSS